MFLCSIIEDKVMQSIGVMDVLGAVSHASTMCDVTLAKTP